MKFDSDITVTDFLSGNGALSTHIILNANDSKDHKLISYSKICLSPHNNFSLQRINILNSLSVSHVKTELLIIFTCKIKDISFIFVQLSSPKISYHRNCTKRPKFKENQIHVQKSVSRSLGTKKNRIL